MTDDVPDDVLWCTDLVAKLSDEGLAEGMEGCFAAFTGEQLFLQASKPFAIRVTALVALASEPQQVVLRCIRAVNQSLNSRQQRLGNRDQTVVPRFCLVALCSDQNCGSFQVHVSLSDAV